MAVPYFAYSEGRNIHSSKVEIFLALRKERDWLFIPEEVRSATWRLRFSFGKDSLCFNPDEENIKDCKHLSKKEIEYLSNWIEKFSKNRTLWDFKGYETLCEFYLIYGRNSKLKQIFRNFLETSRSYDFNKLGNSFSRFVFDHYKKWLVLSEDKTWWKGAKPTAYIQ